MDDMPETARELVLKAEVERWRSAYLRSEREWVGMRTARDEAVRERNALRAVVEAAKTVAFMVQLHADTHALDAPEETVTDLDSALRTFRAALDVISGRAIGG